MVHGRTDAMLSFLWLVVGEERVRLQPHALEDPQVQHLIKVS